MIFHHPSVWWLLLLALVPLAWWRWLSPRRRGAVAFSSVAPVAAAGTTWVVRTRWVVPLLRTLAVGLLVVCLARPQKPDEQTRHFSEGVAIELVVDRSGSMRANDFRLRGRAVTRLEAVKHVVENFVAGDDDLPGRPDDLIGLVAFAGFADSRCPLTLDHEHLIQTVKGIEFALDQAEGGTAIGDALALAVERLRSLDLRPDLARESPITSKIVILLTDGEQTAGDLEPVTAAKMAATFGIRVYTIGAGTPDAIVEMPVNVGGVTVTQRQRVSIDEVTLNEIARITDAEYFRATDTQSLRDIYARIDELERSEIEQRRYRQFDEMAVQAVQVGRFSLPPLLAVVVVLLALEMMLSHTRYRSLP